MAMHDEHTTYQVNGGGRIHAGQAEVREAFRAQLDAVSNLAFDLKSLFVGETHLVFEATISGTRQDGRALRLNGIDLITLRNGLIDRKRSYVAPATAA